ncbi:CoA transferase [Diaphorobacter sp. HDW4A]|uniref:CaiB/BaiF CoA transferase family protein n=1 Tax=Diaphorobacter sp. HDW4A TaxID=2714924 RepID=UPI00140BC5DC|nr:CoA transferase [Diaphorobacter sp. HDW4A]QIL80180.1 CoA transferase [Diaphorobacter sp. HDW4A]
MQHIPSNAQTSPAQPLRGITVVELCHSIAGPYAGAILAQLGANVIKIEVPGKGDDARYWGPPDPSGTSAIFKAMNRDKKGVTLDLKNPEDRDALCSFITNEADVVIQNMRPGTAAKLGLGAGELCAAKPSLIYCNLGAYGAVGPLNNHPGYDPLMQAQGGIMSVTGDGAEPARAGVSLVDQGAGMWAVIGIQAALHELSLTGRGCVVDTSLFETSLAWMSVHITGYLAYGELRRPMGSGIYEIVPHQSFVTSDGHVMVAAGNDSLFRKLTKALGVAGLADDPRMRTNDQRVIHRAAVIDPLSDVFRREPTAHWIALLETAGIPAAPLQTVDQVIADAQTRALAMIQNAPGSATQVVGLPLSFNGERAPNRLAAPQLGEHNALLDNYRGVTTQ